MAEPGRDDGVEGEGRYRRVKGGVATCVRGLPARMARKQVVLIVRGNGRRAIASRIELKQSQILRSQPNSPRSFGPRHTGHE